MNFIKQVMKKLLIAGVTGALILGFVYFKDNYLDEGNSDLEVLNSTSIAKEEPVSVPEPTTVSKKLSIEVVKPVQSDVNIESEPVVQKSSDKPVKDNVVASYDEPTSAQSEDSIYEEHMEYKKGMDATFNELDKEMKNY